MTYYGHDEEHKYFRAVRLWRKLCFYCFDLWREESCKNIYCWKLFKDH